MNYNEIMMYLFPVLCFENGVGEPNWIRNAGCFSEVSPNPKCVCMHVCERPLGFFISMKTCSKLLFFLSAEQACFCFVVSAAPKTIVFDCLLPSPCALV